MSTPVLPFDGPPNSNDDSQSRVLANRPVPQELAIIPSVSPSPQASPKPKEYDPRTDIAVWAVRGGGKPEPLNWKLFLEGLGLVTMAGIDNVLAYLTFFTVRAFHGRLYNIVDLHLTLLPGIDIVLLGFALLGTFAFIMMVVLVECFKLPVFHELMNFRLFFSGMPCGIICAILLYYSERTQWAPFATVAGVLCTTFVWCLHMRLRYGKTLNVVSKISLDISWFVALLIVASLSVLYATDQLKVLTKSDEIGCPYAPNERMPVFALPLQRWYCAPWDEDEPMMISRPPVNTKPVQLSCSDSFIAAFGISIEPHAIECPVGCLRTFSPSQGTNVVGCGVYSVDSPICVAAIHAGALTDTGGQAVIYGRVGVSHFQRCSRNSVTSVDRFITQSGGGVSVTQPSSGGGSSPFLASGGRRLAVTVPTVLDPLGKQVPQAFHFNNDEYTHEFVWLKKYEKVAADNTGYAAGVQDGKPWTQIEATVSLRFAGIELEDEKVRLGNSAPQQLFVQPRPGQVFDAKPAECQIRESGVVCTGAGAAVVQLDFCRKEVKECPNK